MFVELHILQNFAPSNLNRDDTGAPKDCEFGGYRRARISSQCIKRAIRGCFREMGLLSEAELAVRTKRVVEDIAKRLVGKGRPLEQARTVIENALGSVRLTVGTDGKSQYLLFLGKQEIDNLATLCEQYWDVLAGVSPRDSEVAGRRSGRAGKSAGREAVPADVTRAVERVLDGGKAADLALFGRMLADLPEKNIDAASQVAHAISTNRVSMEFDFYTAVDDLKPEDTAGADMMGTVEFNSACFYRYSNVDMEQLKSNLDGDEELACKTLDAFLRASVAAVPSGKQNSMAAHNPPSFAFAVVRGPGLWNLANAFLKPVHPSGNDDLVQRSIAALDSYWGRLASVYGEGAMTGKWAFSLDPVELTNLKGCLVETAEDLYANVLNAVRGSKAQGRAS